jgi:HEXXH motif-containing protein
VTDDAGHHRLTPVELAAIARGDVTTGFIRRLRAAELSKHKLLLEAVRRTAVDALSRDDEAVLAAALRTLGDVHARAPAVAEAVLVQPHVGGWAVDCLDRLANGGFGREDLGYLAALAAVAGIRANVRFDAAILVRKGRAGFPGLGVLALPGAHGWASVRSDASEVTVTCGRRAVRLPADLAAQNDHWVPVQRVQVETDGLVLDAAIDCDDRFLHRFGARVRPLAPSDHNGWRDQVRDGWSLLARYHPATARAIGTGPVTLVPLAEPVPGHSYSATSGWTFGAIAATRPVDGLSMAVTLVHEFHHLVLGAVEDVVSLAGQDSRTLCYAPWRDDPRPVGGLLQGVYAHLAMIQFWRRHRAAGPLEHRRRAENELARWRTVTFEAARTLVAAPDLTAAGRTVAKSMHELLASWQHEPLDAMAERRATAMSAAHRSRWRLTHLHPDGEMINALARAWLRGEPGSLMYGAWPSMAERAQVAAALSVRLRSMVGDPPPESRLIQWLG